MSGRKIKDKTKAMQEIANKEKYRRVHSLPTHRAGEPIKSARQRERDLDSYGGTSVGDPDLFQPTTINKSSRVQKTMTPSKCHIISQSRKAIRIKFFRNGNRHYAGMIIPVCAERYRSFESLQEDLTRRLAKHMKMPAAVSAIYAVWGIQIYSLNEFAEGESYVCLCNGEAYKNINYDEICRFPAPLTLVNKTGSGRATKSSQSQKSLKKTDRAHVSKSSNKADITTTSAQSSRNRAVSMEVPSRNTFERHFQYGGAGAMQPRVVTLIRNGIKPRGVVRLFLNKRNCQTYDNALEAIAEVVKPDCGFIGKVFSISGEQVTKVEDLLNFGDVFVVYGAERVNKSEDFKLATEEKKAIEAILQRTRSVGSLAKTPKSPRLSKKNLAKFAYVQTGADEGPRKKTRMRAGDLPNVIRKRYIFGKKLGDGTFSSVYRIKDRESNELFALKIVDKQISKSKLQLIQGEVGVQKKLCHPNIVSLILEVEEPKYCFLVLEYISGGDLFNVMKRAGTFSEDQARLIITHLARALAYMHCKNVVHRDVKLENLFVELDFKDHVGMVKLGDFGLACEVTGPLFTICGTLHYAAPECFSKSGYGLKIDIWAAGVLLYILFSGQLPFDAKDEKSVSEKIASGAYDLSGEEFSEVSDGACDLLNNLLQVDPDIRFSGGEILDHYWIMNVEEFV